MTPDFLCIGSVLWDMIGRTESRMTPGADVAGTIQRLPGGVVMNIAVTLARLNQRPALLTAIGRDPEGDELMDRARAMGLVMHYVWRSATLSTDRYMAIEDDSGLIAAIADAHSLEAAGDAILRPLADGRLGSAQAPFAGRIVLDGNLTVDLLAEIARSPLFSAADLYVVPASPGKADRLRPLMRHPRATLYVNLEEACILGGARFSDSRSAAIALVAAGATRVLVTDGARDATDLHAGGEPLTRAARAVRAVRVTGAGDTFLAAHMVAESRGESPAEALARAQDAAADHVAGETT
ncbi:MAG: ribokinase family sugar kinase [Rhodobacteraceae bacterium HLUCCA12]|nr:MAG: ribokinase family sugar kinase [Rhodobacteraceae bacterium HLUCCA12]